MFLRTKVQIAKKRLTPLYISSLSVVALLSMTGQFLIQRQLTQQQHQLHVIGEAESQLIMNQQLSKAALALHFAPNQQQQQRNRSELETLVNHWAAPSQFLAEAMTAAVSGNDAAELQTLFVELEATFEAMMALGKQMLAIAPDTIGEGTSAEQSNLITQMLVEEETFTQGMKQIIQRYEQRLMESIYQLKLIEGSLFALTLLILLLEGCLIFRPAINQLNATLEQLASEQEKSERLLLNMLPEPIADRLKVEPQSIADSFSDVTVLFADIVGFTELSHRLPPEALVAMLNGVFSRLDDLTVRHGLEKIKTIGDAYMVVAGLPNPRPDHAVAIANMALEIQAEIKKISAEVGYPLDMRIGIHSGPVVAGVIGIKKFVYDIWGDTVNVASRMESHGKAGKIQVTEATQRYLQEHFSLEERGIITVKGKGDMKTFWLGDRVSFTAPDYKTVTLT
ncbi:MAG: adenylate/guanylate cyclase domain-containing protein [Cyanobacteria bacterium P01_F01_bin.150]